MFDLTTFIKVGNNREEAYKDFVNFENGFDEEYRVSLSFEDFCKELNKGYNNSNYLQIARLLEKPDGTIWYDTEYVA